MRASQAHGGATCAHWGKDLYVYFYAYFFYFFVYVYLLLPCSCASALTHPSILLELWLVAALGLGHGVAIGARRGRASCPRMPQKRKAEARYCNSCGETHLHTLWHFSEDYVFCHGAYMRAYRAVLPGEPCHPSWIMLLEGLWSIDRTGHLINSLSARPDTRALVTMNTLLCGHRLWSKTPHVLVAGGFFLQGYWLVPMIRLWDSLKKVAPAAVTKKTLQRAWSVVEAEMQGLRMQGGALIRSSTQGFHPLKNPSERRTGKDRFMQLAEEIGPWRECCQELAALFEHAGDVNLLDVLNVLKSATALTVFDGACNYKNLRIARALVVMVSKNFTDTPEEWQLWRAMSPHVAQAIRDMGLWSPSEALRFRDGLRVKLNMPTYGFQDLTCFICLLQSLPLTED